MSDEELLKKAEQELIQAFDENALLSVMDVLLKRSSAASLLVIARNSLPVEVGQPENTTTTITKTLDLMGG